MTSQEINVLLEKQRKYYRSGATIPVKTRCFIKSFKDKCIVVAVTELVCNIFYEFILYFKLSVFCFKYLHFSFELLNLGHFFHRLGSASVIFELVQSAFFIFYTFELSFLLQQDKLYGCYL